MKNLVVVVLMTTLLVVSSCSKEETIQVQTETLSQQEKADLEYSREEEKLARDVYLYSYDKYGLVVFNNIAQSEQQHMDQILVLLNKYQLEDPAFSQRGVFKDQALQNLYNNFTSQSDISLIEALKVGAIIEDFDINDLNILESNTDKTDLLSTYANLKCGSRNHMRSFNTQLLANGINYQPEYISLEDFIEIINSTNEQCGR